MDNMFAQRGEKEKVLETLMDNRRYLGYSTGKFDIDEYGFQLDRILKQAKGDPDIEQAVLANIAKSITPEGAAIIFSKYPTFEKFKSMPELSNGPHMIANNFGAPVEQKQIPTSIGAKVFPWLVGVGGIGGQGFSNQ